MCARKRAIVEWPISPYGEAANFLLVKECFYAYSKLSTASFLKLNRKTCSV